MAFNAKEFGALHTVLLEVCELNPETDKAVDLLTVYLDRFEEVELLLRELERVMLLEHVAEIVLRTRRPRKRDSRAREGAGRGPSRAGRG